VEFNIKYYNYKFIFESMYLYKLTITHLKFFCKNWSKKNVIEIKYI